MTENPISVSSFEVAGLRSTGTSALSYCIARKKLRPAEFTPALGYAIQFLLKRRNVRASPVK